MMIEVFAVLRTRHPKFAIHRFASNLKNHPSGSSYAMLKESASHHVSSMKLLTTSRGQSLWILCASTGNVWMLCYFCGFIWLRGGVVWTLSSLQNSTFLMELWWPGKLPEPPWTHLGSSSIISGGFKTFHKFDSVGHNFRLIQAKLELCFADL